MMRGVIRRSQNHVANTSSDVITQNSTFDRFFKKPALALAFLMAILASMYVVRHTTQSQSVAPVSTQIGTSLEATNPPNVPEVPGAESQAGVSTEALGSTSNSVTTQTTIGNGASDVKLNVNGQDIPMPQSSSSTQIISDNGNTTSIDVSINNGQTTTTTTGSASNYSTSFSTSFQSQTISGNN